MKFNELQPSSVVGLSDHFQGSYNRNYPGFDSQKLEKLKNENRNRMEPKSDAPFENDKYEMIA